MGEHQEDKAPGSDQLPLLAQLNDQISLSDKLQALLEYLRQKHVCINRIAVALYDENTDVVKTFAHVTDGKNPLLHYQSSLSESASLVQIKNERKPRVLNDLELLKFINTEHSQKISASNFKSSFTVPIFQGNHFHGFIFFNSSRQNTMKDHVIADLMVVAHLISVLIINELNFITTVKGVTHSMAMLASYRDLETGQHLNRVSHFSRIIARGLAELYGFNDEFIEQLFTFSSMHDIGKIAIPDKILCKPGRFTAEEFTIMQGHTIKGREIILELQEDLNMLSSHNTEILSNIVCYHHENWDGSGYPKGLSGKEIPLEARIVSVADVFDALTCKRVYKKSWPFEQAAEYLVENKEVRFDPDCVDKFLEYPDEIKFIMKKFKETKN